LGIKLGSRVDSIHHKEHCAKDHPEQRAELDAMSFRWGV